MCDYFVWDSDHITSEPLSLKEALIAKRPNFPQSVEKRLAEAKEKARISTQVAQQHSEHGRTVAMWKKSRSIAGQSKIFSVSFKLGITVCFEPIV